MSEFPPPPPGKAAWPWVETYSQIPIAVADSYPLPRISIVTPSYNQGQFIEETIRSVLLQAYPNLEYIIIDGGSTDGSVEIIKKYEPWLDYWVSEKDKGQSHAINKGLGQATGEIVAWINSDDYYAPNVLNHIAQIWRGKGPLGFVHGFCEVIDINGKKTGKLIGEQFDLIRTLETCRNPVAQPSTFMNRRALDEIGLLDESMNMSMDWDLWLRIGSRYPTLFFPEVYSFLRQWPDAKTSKIWSQSGSDHIKSVKKLLSESKIEGVDKRMLRKAIGVAYGRDAHMSYFSHNMMRFRYSFIRSYILAPELRGGMARNLIWQFLVGNLVLSYMSLVKRLIHKCL